MVVQRARGLAQHAALNAELRCRQALMERGARISEEIQAVQQERAAFLEERLSGLETEAEQLRSREARLQTLNEDLLRQVQHLTNRSRALEAENAELRREAAGGDCGWADRRLLGAAPLSQLTRAGGA